MVEQPVQWVALVSQQAAPDENINIQQVLEQNLFQRYAFQQKRFQTAFTISLMATAGVIIGLLALSALNLFNVRQLPESFRFYAQFREWRAEEALQYPICAWNCEIGTQFTRLFFAASDIKDSIIGRDGLGNIAGMARLCSLLSIVIAAWFAFRRQLASYYALNGEQAQLEDFNTTPRWQFWLSRALYTLATLFGAYVVLSILWLGLSFMFKNMVLDWFSAAVIVIAFTATVTFITAYNALVASTRDVLVLGLMIFLVGFAVSFALAPPTMGRQWWENAVSNAGQFNPSASLFTGTLLSGSLALIVLWFDINSILQKMIDDGTVRWLNGKAWMRVAGILYAVLVLGLVFVGFIRVDTVNHPFNTAFHTGGAVLAIVSVVVCGLLIRKHRFHPWYKIFSVHILLGATISMAVLGSIRLAPFAWVAPGTGLIQLTVIELALFTLIGLWVYVTVDNLLNQANIRAFDGRVLVMAKKDIT
jgi:hypothetical protein